MPKITIHNQTFSYDEFMAFLDEHWPTGTIDDLKMTQCAVYNIPQGIHPFTYRSPKSYGNGSVIMAAGVERFFGRRANNSTIANNEFTHKK